MRHNNLTRINGMGVTGIWECKCGTRGTVMEIAKIPCTSGLATDDDLISAIEGKNNA